MNMYYPSNKEIATQVFLIASPTVVPIVLCFFCHYSSDYSRSASLGFVCPFYIIWTIVFVPNVLGIINWLSNNLKYIENKEK